MSEVYSLRWCFAVEIAFQDALVEERREIVALPAGYSRCQVNVTTNKSQIWKITDICISAYEVSLTLLFEGSDLRFKVSNQRNVTGDISQQRESFDCEE
jgi:hypothetical protein